MNINIYKEQMERTELFVKENKPLQTSASREALWEWNEDRLGRMSL